MRHPYYRDLTTRLNENLKADAKLRTVAREFRRGLMQRFEAEAVLRAVGCFEAEIREALS